MRPPNRQPEGQEEPPPLLRTWGRLYAAVILYLALLIAGFYLFGRRFTP